MGNAEKPLPESTQLFLRGQLDLWKLPRQELAAALYVISVARGDVYLRVLGAFFLLLPLTLVFAGSVPTGYFTLLPWPLFLIGLALLGVGWSLWIVYVGDLRAKIDSKVEKWIHWYYDNFGGYRKKIRKL